MSYIQIEELQRFKEYYDKQEGRKYPCKELDNTGIRGKYVGIPIIEVPALISWLNDQKYINIDETSDDMTEEFEKEHQWELSRNCFINKMIKKLEELK